MQKNKKHARRILTMTMALAMTATLTVPAMAAEEPYTVTIMPNENTLTPATEEDTALTERFNAYAVFEGVLDGYEQDSLSNKLSDITWGSGVDKDKLGELLLGLTKSSITMSALGISDVAELAKNSGYELTPETTLGEVFTQALKKNEYEVSDEAVTPGKKENLNGTASVIAVVMSNLNSVAADGNNAVLANEFASILAARNETVTNGDVYIYLDETALEKSSWVAEDAPTPAHWKFELDAAGYYLIVDTYEGNGEASAVSEYILSVFGDQEVQIKSDIPTVNKTIAKTTTADGKDSTTDDERGASAGIGDTVAFTLTGTLPENFTNYPSYRYIFHDTLSQGLSLNSTSVKVYAVSPDGDKYELSEGAYTVKTDQVHDTVKDSLDIVFTNLKTVASGKGADGETATFTLNEMWKIAVEYTATVTKDAVVVAPDENGEWTQDVRNRNDVYLEFTNNAYDSGSTGETPDSSVYVYTYGLQVNKIDGVSQSPLAGAEFALTYETGDEETYYAVFTRHDTALDEGTAYEYVIDRWIEADELEAIVAGIDGWTWGTPIETEDNSPVAWKNGTYYLSVTSVAADDKLTIKGLDEGTYTLREVKTPAVYETMDDITFTIVPTIEEANTDAVPQGALTALTVASEDDARDDVSFGNTTQGGYIYVTLHNMPSGYLPGTGGVGTVLFYTGGVVMLALGGVHIYRRKQLKASL